MRLRFSFWIFVLSFVGILSLLRGLLSSRTTRIKAKYTHLGRGWRGNGAPITSEPFGLLKTLETRVDPVKLDSKVPFTFVPGNSSGNSTNISINKYDIRNGNGDHKVPESISQEPSIEASKLNRRNLLIYSSYFTKSRDPQRKHHWKFNFDNIRLFYESLEKFDLHATVFTDSEDVSLRDQTPRIRWIQYRLQGWTTNDGRYLAYRDHLLRMAVNASHIMMVDCFDGFFGSDPWRYFTTDRNELWIQPENKTWNLRKVNEKMKKCFVGKYASPEVTDLYSVITNAQLLSPGCVAGLRKPILKLLDSTIHFMGLAQPMRNCNMMSMNLAMQTQILPNFKVHTAAEPFANMYKRNYCTQTSQDIAVFLHKFYHKAKCRAGEEHFEILA